MLFLNQTKQSRGGKFFFESDFIHEHVLASFRKAGSFLFWDSALNASVHLLRKALPAVVHLETRIDPNHRSAAILGTERAGTGVVLTSCGGLILTAYYLLIGADRVQVQCPDGRRVEGRVFGIDYASGLGIVAPEESGLDALSLSPGGLAQRGSEAFVVASVGEERRVASGFVISTSPFDALWEFALDPAIYFSAPNPGLGGGPLLDRQGGVLGIAALSMAHAGRPTVVFPGAGSLAMIDAIERDGVYRTPQSQGWLGMTCLMVGNHLAVAGIFPESPAAAGGLIPGDSILLLQGHAVANRIDLYQRLRAERPGAALRFRVRRGGEVVELSIEAGAVETYFA